MKFQISKKVFIHVDCDSFFAECEIFRKPYLKNSYVLVGEEIVLACNYKTKALGIKTGTAVWEAKEKLKGKGIFFKSDHNFYSYVSSKLMLYLKKNTLSLEPFSIDEAFCEITGLAEMNNLSLESYIKKLQLDILKKVGVPVSIGVSNTRIKAKIFSKINKPFGYYISLNSKDDIDLFKKLHLNIVPFIGKSSFNKLKYKSTNIYDFLMLGYDRLKSIIGKNATDLRFELLGVNAYTVKKSKYSKSMSRSRSFNKNKTNDRDILYKKLVLNFDYLYEEMIEKSYKTKKISVMLRDINFVTYYYNYDFGDYIFSRKHLFLALKKLFFNNFDSSKIYRSTGVVFPDIKKEFNYQFSLFDSKKSGNNFSDLNLIKSINKVNDKYGDYKVGYGFSLLDNKKSSKLGFRF